MEEQSIRQQPVEPTPKTGRGAKLKQLLHTKKGKALAGLSLMILVLLLLLAIPQTRYVVYGQLAKKDVAIKVVSQQGGVPVSDVVVSIDDQKGKTDKDGKVVMKQVPAAPHKVVLSKNYYAKHEAEVLVPLFSKPDSVSVNLKAEGKQVAITVIDAVSKQPLANAQLAGGGVSGVTSNEGKASIVLSSNAQKHTLKVGRDGYNERSAEIVLDPKTEAQAATIELTPKGSITYLSKATGKINVMRANPDGTNASVIVEGTGNEDDRTTVLLSTRDWQFSLLQARRNGQNEALYLVDNTNGSLTLVDEGAVSFELAGWSGHVFAYKANRPNAESWTDKASAIKLYNADSKTLTTVDETRASGTNFYDYRSEIMTAPYILDNEIVYLKWWTFGQYAQKAGDERVLLMTVNPSNRLRKTAHTFDAQGDNGVTVSYRLYKPQELYIGLVKDYNYEQPTFYEYENGKVVPATGITPAKYEASYPTYLISPSGKKALWYEERDGKNIIFVGGKNGEDQKQIATSSDYRPYGWYGDDDRYILLSKDNSQLFIASPDRLADEKYTPLKITNYHRPVAQYFGYGYGYGGL